MNAILSEAVVFQPLMLLSYTEDSAISRLEERQQQAKEENGENCVLYL
jgi:hypothetical protein